MVVARPDGTHTLEVTCPEDGAAGETISINFQHEDGSEGEIDVEVPEGVQPGETFEVHLAA